MKQLSSYYQVQMAKAQTVAYCREKSYLHDYPHCWNRPPNSLLCHGFMVRQMTAVKEKLLQFNDGVEWAPDWVGEGRLENG